MIIILKYYKINELNKYFNQNFKKLNESESDNEIEDNESEFINENVKNKEIKRYDKEIINKNVEINKKIKGYDENNEMNL